METSSIWWLLAGSLVALELATGTFYLLMLALGMAAGACAAHGGLALSGQLVTASAVASATLAIWHWLDPKKKIESIESNHDVHLDLGSVIKVSQWASTGETKVMHRGAIWTARLSHPPQTRPPQAGWHRIAAVDGNTLVLTPI